MTGNWTREQSRVIETRGKSLLVSAAAGSGKTAVLVERILREILDPVHPVDLDRLLIVTFTRAAAAQLRERIREAVTVQYGQHPSDERLRHQMSLLGSDHIMTIDRFFLMVIREHYEEIGLDPSFRIGDEGELKLMRSDVAGAVLEEAYQKGDAGFLRFSECYASGNSDRALEDMILAFWENSTSHAFPEKWRRGCLESYTCGADGWPWLGPLLDQVRSQLKDILGVMEQALRLCESPGGPGAAAQAVLSDRQMVEKIASEDSYDGMYRAFGAMTFVRITKKPKKGEEPYDPEKTETVSDLRDGWKKQLLGLRDRFFSRPLGEEEALEAKTGADAAVLVRLTDRFEEMFREEKEKKNLLDFSDISHLAREVLITERGDGELVPTRAAEEYQDYFEEIAIDEYQDSNEIQELLLSAVSRERQGVFNRFMVGDVKQSIYRFRMSDPGIFMDKYESYGKEDEDLRKDGTEGRLRIDLHRNFRSRREVLDAVNLIFRQIMRREVGGISYGEDESLYPGAVFPEYPEPWKGQEERICVPELLLVQPEDAAGGMEDARDPETEESAGPEEPQTQDRVPDRMHAEAEVTAARIEEMVGKDPVWDRERKEYRPAEYRDIVILLRTSSEWANVYSEVLSQHGIPNRSGSRTGYFSAPEVQTVLAYLNVLDNPRQDIPLAASLRSAIGGLTDDELAAVKAGKRKAVLYDCVEDYLLEHEEASPEETEAQKVLTDKLKRFRSRTRHLRDRVSDTPIHQLLWEIYDETGFSELCEVSPGGKQKKANLDMLVEKAMAYEQTSYRGLFHFVRYIEKLIRYEVDFGTALSDSGNENLVRIMTIHSSKGLEFPVVFVCGLGKRFNRSDGNGMMVRDPKIGLGMNYVDPDLRVQVPTLIRSAAAERTIREGIGEELRILYVAMTRAEEKLILAGCVADREKAVRELIQGAGSAEEKLPEMQILNADSYLTWILAALARHRAERSFFDAFRSAGSSSYGGPAAGLPGCIRVRTGREVLAGRAERARREEADVRSLLHADPAKVYDRELHEKLRRQFSSVYPYPDLTKVPAKVTVSELKRAGYETEMARLEQDVPDAEIWQPDGPPSSGRTDFEPCVPKFLKPEGQRGALTGAQAGTAYHRFLADYDFTREPEEGSVSGWLETMVRCDKITENERRAVKPARLEHFLRSDLGARMRDAARRGTLWRENPFVLSVPAGELYPEAEEHAGKEPVLIQGTIDAWFENPDGSLVLVDYKTDYVREGQEESLARRYRTQLLLYRSALERLTGRKVRETCLYSLTLGRTVRLPDK